ncbi:MAG: hypothetical protein CMB70_00205 [Euryarchaeota archaeon]|nr:hypothetical protein [Euryarchaeota archaeon]
MSHSTHSLRMPIKYARRNEVSAVMFQLPSLLLKVDPRLDNLSIKMNSEKNRKRLDVDWVLRQQPLLQLYKNQQ